MRKTIIFILLILAFFVCSCDINNTSNARNTVNANNTTKSLTDDDYFAQQALKNNYSDKVLFGLSFSMSKEQVRAQLKKVGAVDYYSTYYAQERKRLKDSGELNTFLPYDYCMPNEEVFEIYDIILKTEDGEYLNQSETLMIDFDNEEPYKPYEIKVYTFGRYDEKAINGDGKTFRAIKTTLVEKYGDPYCEKTNKYILWVDGVIHIKLTFEGFKNISLHPIERLEFGRLQTNYDLLCPLFLITYSDWSYPKKKEKEMEEFLQKDQERLKNEYNSREHKGL